MKDTKQKASIPRKSGVLLLATVLLMAALTAGGTLAWLIVSSGELENKFLVPELTVSIQEEFGNKKTKSEVKVINESDATKGIDAYIRVALVPTWEIEDEKETGKWNVAPMPATLNDLVISLNTEADDDWFLFEDDGYYYHKTKVEPEGETSILITSAKVDSNTAGAKAGYQMNLQVLAEAIQATETAVTEAWPAGIWGKLDTTVEP